MKAKQAVIVVGLGFGDEGKGATVDTLTRKHDASLVVRFNGGAQAAHRVVTPEGKTHVFSQFGSGTLAGPVETYLSEFMVVDPAALVLEAVALEKLGILHPEPLMRVMIHEDATVVTPQHVALNRLRELARGKDRFGTTGCGITNAVEDRRNYGADRVIRVEDFKSGTAQEISQWLDKKMLFLQSVHADEVWDITKTLARQGVDRDLYNPLVEVFNSLDSLNTFLGSCHVVHESCRIIDDSIASSMVYDREGTIIFEGAQGALLDQYCGYNPYTTRSNTGLENAELLLERNNYSGSASSIGVTRAYATRHGPGPFPTEDTELTEKLPDEANTEGTWQGSFRVGWLDLVGIRHALNTVAPVDSIAITCMDRIQKLGAVYFNRSYSSSLAENRVYDTDSGLPLHSSLGDRKTRLTQIVESCKPSGFVIVTPQHIPNVISKTFSIPVIGTSWGPSSKDWTWTV